MNNQGISFFLNQRGLSLVSTMIAAAILGGLMLSFTQALSSGLKGVKTIKTHVNFDIALSNLGYWISRRSVCKDMFRRSGAEGAEPARFGHEENSEGNSSPMVPDHPVKALTRIQYGSEIKELQAGATFGGVKVLDLSFRYRRNMSGVFVEPSPGPGADKWTHDVEFIIQAASQGSYGSGTISNRNSPFRFLIVTNADDNIVDCNPI